MAKDNITLEIHTSPIEPAKQFSHYHKPCPYDSIDVYRVLLLFNVTDPCLQHALKKLLVAGGRHGPDGKDVKKDVHEAIVSLVRWEEMRTEEANGIRQAP